MKALNWIAGVVFVLALTTVGFAQDNGMDLQKMQERIESLEREIDAMKEEESSLNRFFIQADAANALNPSIAVIGNFVGRMDNREVLNEDGDPIDDRFNMRETEFDFRAAVDPYADAVVVAALHSEVPGEFEMELEEGYVVIKSLPSLERPPAGTKLKLGKFNVPLGGLNRLHTHNLPWVTRPLPLQHFLGHEGYSDNGAEFQFFLPSWNEESTTLEGHVGIVNGGGIEATEDNGGNSPAFFGRVNAFMETGEFSDFNFGISYLTGNTDADNEDTTNLFVVDAVYRSGHGSGKENSWLIGGEFYSADIENAANNDPSPTGYTLFGQYQTSQNMYLGARYDMSEEIDDDSIENTVYALVASYYTSEFLRFRLQYEHAEFDTALNEEDIDTVLFEVNFVIGAHPPHPYWVNR
jgi:hypothetical protein